MLKIVIKVIHYYLIPLKKNRLFRPFSIYIYSFVWLDLPRNIATILGISAPGGSSGPASTSKTFHSGTSLSRAATTAPADPPIDQKIEKYEINKQLLKKSILRITENYFYYQSYLI